MVFLDRGQDGQIDTVTLFVYFETDTALKKQACPCRKAGAGRLSGNRSRQK